MLVSESPEGFALRAAQVKRGGLNQSPRQGQRNPLVAGAGVRRQRVRVAPKLGEPGSHLARAQASDHVVGNAKGERCATQCSALMTCCVFAL